MLIVRHAVVGPFAENTYLVADSESGEAALIDPGGDLERVLALCEPGSLRISCIFLTHGHIDHVAGCAEAKARLGVPCQIHRDDSEWLDAIGQQAEMFGFEGERLEHPGIEKFHQDGDSFALGGQRATILHTPGHSRGSSCLFFEQARVLSCDLKEGYYLVLVIDPNANEGIAWHHLSECRRKLIAEL